MTGIVLLHLLSQTLHLVLSSYLHVPSLIELKPLEEPGENKGADFGFSIAYQKGITPNLVIGSPHGDLNGQVFNCRIEDILRNETSCKQLDIDVEKLAPDTVRSELNNVEQNYCLGASIAPTADFIFTCAPLWTTTLKYSTQMRRKPVSGPFGICFVHDGKYATRYTGAIERRSKLQRNPTFSNIGKLIGGHGWNILVDETSGYILISKPSEEQRSDILFVSVSEPTSPVKFMRDGKGKKIQKNIDLLSDDYNIGNALAKGQFFSNTNETMYYAFSLQDKYGTGKVGFAKMIPDAKQLAIEAFGSSMVAITASTVGSQFGAALLGVDINADNVTDLLVGAPAYADKDLSLADVGALYIYLGGEMESINEERRRLEILASEDGGRFGTAIAAADIDGDGFPEIFVSAPYENEGVGALYILSGYEVNKMIGSYVQIRLSDIRSQRIQPKDSLSYGFSLQVVNDFDQNGCDDLAVGSPGIARVMLHRCLPAMKVSVSTKLVEKNVKENDKQFNVAVCVDVQFPDKVNSTFPIKTKLLVTCSIIGNGAFLTRPHYDINLVRTETQYCENVNVKLKYNETGDYKFTVEMKSNEDTFLETKEFENSWVVMNPRSKTTGSLNIPRYCDDINDCTPKLEMSLYWEGIAFSHSKTYDLGSRSQEEITVLVNNTGTATNDGCVHLSFRNAHVVNISCGVDDEGDYICYLPRPLQRNNAYPINIWLDMTKYTNMDNKKILNVFTSLYDNCNHQNSSKKSLELDVELKLDTKVVEVLGSPNNITVTDVEVLNQKSKVINYEHEYQIINKGVIKWDSVNVIVRITQKPFITKYGVYEISASDKMNCTRNDTGLDMVEFNCLVDLLPNSNTKLFVVMDVNKKGIASNLETSSECSIAFLPTSVTITKHITSEIKYIKEITVGNKKWLIILIAVIVAILILAAVVFILYKVGFFKRKQKERLDSFRETVRRQSVKKSTADSVVSKPEDEDMDDLDIEVLDDCPFGDAEVPTTSADDVNLIVETHDEPREK